MNLTQVALVVTVIVNVGLGITVFLRNPKASSNRAMFYATIVLSGWALTNYLVDNSRPIYFSQISAYLTFAFGFLSMNSLLLFTYFFPTISDKKKWKPKIFWTLTAVFCLICSSPLVVGKVTRQTETYVNVATGPLYFIFIISLVVMFILVLRNLFISLKLSKDNPIQRTQVKIILFGMGLSLFLGVLFNAVLPAITTLETSKYGPIFITILIASFSVAIIRHKLFDIRLAVVRSLTYILTIAFLGVVYGFVAFQFANVFIKNLSVVGQEAFYTILAVVLAFTFQPIRKFFEHLTTRIFYRDKYDPQELVTSIGRILASEIELNKLSAKVIGELTTQMKIGKAEIVVFNGKGILYQNKVFTHDHHKIVNTDLKKLGRLIVINDELQAGERKQVMQDYNISVSLALRTSEQFLGYLLLGEKKSGTIYNSEDIKTLKIIANELSVAVQNAKAFTEIQQFNLTLQEKVEIATKKLRHVNEQLRLLDAAKDEFISMASHQLRTPLTTVKGYASMLEEGDFGKLNKEQKDKVELTLDGATRMARLIDDLLNVSRMDANRFFLELGKVDLNKVVPEELAQLKNLAASKHVEIKYTSPSKPIPEILLDENKTRQVIMNLADNAVHYSQPTDLRHGSGSSSGGVVNISLGVEGECVVYKVQDNGIGVPKEAQAKLFTKMFRATNAKDLRPDGTGLGLYLVKRVIEDQGGSIIFESTEGKGSTFGFKLPLSGVPKELQAKSKVGEQHFAKTHKE